MGALRPVARLAEVSHPYGKTCALETVTLEIPSGCMVGLIGPDGVGKSTLLGVIAGAKRIQAGSVEVLVLAGPPRSSPVGCARSLDYAARLFTIRTS